MNLEKEIFEIALKDIMPNRFQPREIFDDEALQELAQSIKAHGVIQPIIVRKVGDKYEIIAGERRYRASQLAGKTTIPALVRDIDDKEAAKIALLENLQRKDLTPIEEAKTYQTILKLDNITQEELAQNLGKSQSAIANKLRLLNLDEEVQTALLNSKISERHARSLLPLNHEKQKQLLHKIMNERLTVRQVDEEIMRMTGKMPEPELSEEEGLTNMNVTDNQNINDFNRNILPQDINIANDNVDAQINNQLQNQITAQEKNDDMQVQNSTAITEQNIMPLPNTDVINNEKISSSPQESVIMPKGQSTSPEPPQIAEALSAPLAQEMSNTESTLNSQASSIMTNEAGASDNEQAQSLMQENIDISSSKLSNQTQLQSNEISPAFSSQNMPNSVSQSSVENMLPSSNTTTQPINSNAAQIDVNSPVTNAITEAKPEQETSTINNSTIPQSNIFDKLRVKTENQENTSPASQPQAINKPVDIPTIVNSEPISQPQPTYSDIYDLRFAINNFRQAVQNTEKFGFKVQKEEKDNPNTYQIIITIDY